MRKSTCLLFLFCTSFATIVQAAPFCVQVQGITPQCHYYDTAECRQRAIELNGLCTANDKELTIRAGNAPYCLVDNSRSANCTYPDRRTCDRDASRNGGVCLDTTPLGVAGDPYRQEPGHNY